MALGFDGRDDRVGTLIEGRYRLCRVIGRGDKAVVYEAEDTKSGILRALKMLRADRASSPDALASIQRETFAQAIIGGPNLTVYDRGRSDACWYFVAHLAPGVTLEEIMQIRKGQPLPVEPALWIAADVCRALVDAHNRGIAHGNVCPHNVLVAAATPFVDEQAHLLDFGECRVVDQRRFTTDPSDTESEPLPEVFRATPTSSFRLPRYRLPGHPENHIPSYGHDRFALAALLWEVLTGADPSRADPRTAAATFADRPQVPRSIAAYISKAVTPPCRGGTSAYDMFEDLMAFLRDVHPPAARFPEPPGRAAVSFHHTALRPARIGWRLELGAA